MKTIKTIITNIINTTINTTYSNLGEFEVMNESVDEMKEMFGLDDLRSDSL